MQTEPETFLNHNTSEFIEPSKFQIDPDALDQECIIQPQLIEHFGVAHAKARDHIGAVKKTIGVLEANLDKSIRASAVAEGTRVTEEGIRKEICRSETHKAETDRLMLAENTANVAWVYYQAIQARGSALDHLVRLYVAGYYGTKEGPALRSARISAIEEKLSAVVGASPIKGKRLGDSSGAV